MFDPNEACNLVGDPAYASALADLRGRLERWMKQSEDPLLQDAMQPWPGMVGNPVDDLSPQGPTVPAPGLCLRTRMAGPERCDAQ